jgi:hypothetical protein
MFYNLIYKHGRSKLAFLGILGLASFASAQTLVVTSAGSAAKHVELQDLRQAHKLLAEADHDYDGHRARAAEEVHKAIRELESKHRPKKVVTGQSPVVTAKPVKVKQPAVHESQTTSDAQLRQALQLLESAAPEINSKHPKAASNVAAAIQELNTALKIR